MNKTILILQITNMIIKRQLKELDKYKLKDIDIINYQYINLIFHEKKDYDLYKFVKDQIKNNITYNILSVEKTDNNLFVLTLEKANKLTLSKKASKELIIKYNQFIKDKINYELEELTYEYLY